MDSSFSHNYPLKQATNLMLSQKTSAEEDEEPYMRQSYFNYGYQNCAVQENLDDGTVSTQTNGDAGGRVENDEHLEDSDREVHMWTTSFEDEVKVKDPPGGGGEYSYAFFNHQLVREELFQQNLLAKQMLYKYFYDEQSKIQDGKENSAEEKGGNEKEVACVNMSSKKISNEAKACIRTVSSILKILVKKDKSGQICIKPSDMYVAIPNPTNVVKSATSLKVIRPYKYHKAYLESLADVDRLIKQTSHPMNKKRCLKDKGLQIACSKEFISARSPEDSQNRLLFRNNCPDRDSSCSLANVDMDCHTKSGEYVSLRNLYGVEYLKNRSLKRVGSRGSSTVFDRRFKFLDSQTNLSVSESEYRKWLKRNDFIKYVTGSVATSASTRGSAEQISLLPEIAKSLKNLTKSTKSSKIQPRRRNYLMRKAVNVDRHVLDPVCQTIIYEHTVVLNFIDLFNYIGIKRDKGASASVWQIIFFMFCYFTLLVVPVLASVDRWSK
nr:unnamed protein product [Callosobruchus chinensis]